MPRTVTSVAEQAARAAVVRTGTSGAEQAAGAAAPSTGSTGDKRRQVAPDWSIRGRTRRGTQLPRTRSTGDKRRPDAPDRIIRVGSSSRTRRTQDWIIRGRTTTRSGRNPQDWIIRGKEACRPGQDCRGGIKRKESPAARLERPRESGGQGRKKLEAEAKVSSEGVMTRGNAKDNAMGKQ